MSVNVADFWRLLGESRLLTPDQCQALHAEYTGMNGASVQGNTQAVAEWLISRNALTGYQSKILEAGRAGPFYYGDYKVYDKIDQGPLSGTFRAIHAPTSHPVLLKFVTGEAASDAAVWARLVEHIKAQSDLVHPCLNQIYEPVDLQSFKFVAMEDPAGQSLEERIGARPLHPQDACRVVRMLSLALATIHQAREIHGDVRPHNLWVQDNGNFLLLRNPMFRATSLQEEMTDTPADLVSRADYMAPELGQPGKSPDVLCDIYALGCTFYQLLSGGPPFAGGDVMQKIARHAAEPIQPLEQFNVPPQIGQLVAYMMAKNPSVRYQQAAVVAEQLTPFVNPTQLQIHAPAPPQSLSSYQQWISQKSSALASQAATEKARPSSFPGIVAAENSGGTVAAAAKVNPATGATPVASTSKPSAGAAVPSKPSAAERFQPKERSKKNTIVLASSLGGALAALLLIVIIAATTGGGKKVAEGEEEKDKVKDDIGEVVKPTDHDPEKDQKSTVDVNTGDASPKVETPHLVQEFVESSELPWGSPTEGPPVALTYVPPNPGMILVARPADLLAAEGEAKVFQALGPEFKRVREKWEEDLSVPLDRVEQIIVSFHSPDGGVPRPAFVVRLRESIPEQTLLANWGNPKSTPVPDAETNFYEAANGWAFYLPREDPNEPVDLIVMGSAEDVKGAAVHGKTGTQELLRLQMKQVLKWSDSDRHFTCLFEPNFVSLESGQKLFAGDYNKIREGLDWLLGDGIQAAMISFHVSDSFYVELRVKSSSATVHQLTEHFRGRLTGIFKEASGYVASLTSSPHWEKLRLVYPMQVKYFKDHARVGIEDDQAVLNSYMPLKSAHNLIAATELSIVNPAGSGGTSPPPARPVVKTLEELLEQKLDLVDIPQQDLIFAVRDVKNEIRDTFRNLPFDFDVVLIGPELMAEGITQNQAVRDFKMENATISEIFTGIMMKANPITTVKVPTEKDQKLVWVIGPDPKDPNRRILLVTTRVAAEANENYKLAKPFQPPSG